MTPSTVEHWYRAQAREILAERVALYSQRSGLRCTAVNITGARTRWGSCSRRGSLSFTWRLVKAPLWVVDYVVAHEIAHLAHHNHSSRFWATVGELYPEFKLARNWLRENQARLTT
jgi:predicted metal-dependent hydrolase